jgi:transposase-like protein
VEIVIHSGKTQAQVARELGVSEYSLNLWRKKYFKELARPRANKKLRSRCLRRYAGCRRKTSILRLSERS